MSRLIHEYMITLKCCKVTGSPPVVHQIPGAKLGHMPVYFCPLPLEALFAMVQPV